MFTGSLRQRECSSSQLAQAKGKAAEELKGVLWGSAGPPWEPPHCPPEGRKALELGFNAAQSGFQYEQSQPREKGSRKHTEPRTNTLMLYTHAHFSLLFFFLFPFAELARTAGAEPGKTNQLYHPIQEVSL